MRVAASPHPLLLQFTRSRLGNVAIIVALVIPVVAVCAAGGTELAFVFADRSKLQDAADAAALAGANQLALGSEASVLERAESHAKVLTVKVAERGTVEVDAEPLKKGGETVGVQVAINSTRPSFFGDLLPPGGFKIRVSAGAMGMGRANLCVFGTSTSVRNSVLVDKGVVTAAGCVVHSNYNVKIANASTVTAAAVQASGVVDGSAANSRDTAAPIEDPFATTLATAPASWTNCKTTKAKINQAGATLELEPGVHCDHMDIDKATLKLKPGVHYIRNKLQMNSGAKLVGDHVTLVFGPDAELDIKDTVRWNLYGNQGLTGTSAERQFAGFVLVADRSRTKDLKLDARVVERLEGVVYSPTATLVIEKGAKAAEQSAWTVLVGEKLEIRDDAQVVLNTDYGASTVPVPSGVGNKSSIAQGATRLSQ